MSEQTKTQEHLALWNPTILVSLANIETLNLEDPLLREAMRRGYRIRQSSSEESATTILNDRDAMVAVILISSQTRRIHALNLLKEAHRHRPLAGIYLWRNPKDPLPFSESELRELGFSGVLIREAEVPGEFPWSNALEQFALLRNSIRDLEGETKSLSQTLGTEVIRDRKNRTFLGLNSLACSFGVPLRHDLFVKIAEDHLVTIVHSGDVFPKDQLMKYVSRGVQFFYITQDAYEALISACESRIEQIETAQRQLRESEPRGIKVAPQVLRSFSYSKEGLQKALLFVRSVRQEIARLNLRRFSDFEHFLARPILLSRALETTLIAGALYPSLEFPVTSPASTIGLAAFFHDIGLIRLPKFLEGGDESKFSAEEALAYRDHPTLGAQILQHAAQNGGGIQAATIRAVREHHFRKNQKGFISQSESSPGSISRISEIIALSAALSEFLRKLPPDLHIEQMFDMVKEKLLPQFSDDMKKIFAQSFLSRTSPDVVKAVSNRLSST